MAGKMMNQKDEKMNRVLVSFSCGAASAVAAKMAVDKYGDRVEVIYCDTLKYEHPDNVRFLNDVSVWIGRRINIIRSTKYNDIFDVFEKTGWLVGPSGARCTTELKRNVRKAYQLPDDIHVFGLTADEKDRITSFEDRNDISIDWILRDNNVTKQDCYRIIQKAGIQLPAMYLLGYNNNNCIGCVKGQSGYWNKIRVDFPEVFDRMAKFERKINVAINKSYKGDGKRKRVFLDELDPKAGHGVPMPDIECGVMCIAPNGKLETISRYDSLLEEEGG
jgi:PP-loop superfamily ATP-utilizing enzyme